jgi:hypothetical protein
MNMATESQLDDFPIAGSQRPAKCASACRRCPGAVSSRLFIRDIARSLRFKAGLRISSCRFVFLRGSLLLLCLLMPVTLVAADRYGSHTAAEFAKHVRELKKKLPSDEFTIVVAPPFVVIGDDEAADVRRRAKNTVQWAVEKLKAAYFTKDPKEILDIWLFKDKESYEENAEKLFHSKPDTPYGYFSESDKALVMNIATGGGTLVHEIVHPFVAANFPECPAWFNEGLGSLYEQSGEKDGRIVGYTNWRLPGLQEAIRKNRVPSFKTLCSTSSEEFYEKDRGTNYAQARYLLYYLQQHNMLRKYYRRFYANRKKDPTGYATLQEILGRNDMAAFQREWEAYVLKLRFR